MDATIRLEPSESEAAEPSIVPEVDSTSNSEIRRLLRTPEGKRFEFKEARSSFSFEKLVQYVVALANERGGRILLGVTDARPRKVVGSQAFPEPGRTEAGLFERLRRRVPIEEVIYGGQRLLIVHVPPREPGEVWEDGGVAWSRAGDALVPMPDSQRRLIYFETGDYSAEFCLRAKLSDLDPNAIADFRSRWANAAANAHILRKNDERTLTDAELMKDGKLTYASLILFGTRAALGVHLAQSEVVFEYRSSEAPGPAQDRQEYREGFFRFHDAIWDRINLRNDKQSWQDGFFRTDIATFDEKVAREAILNAVCHREYRLGGSIFVRQYARRLEVVSPGGFPEGITTENILDEQNPRNRRLAESFARCGLVERAGQGMDLIYERTIRHSKPLPDFNKSHDHKVFLTLHGTMTDEAFVRFLDKFAAKCGVKLTIHDLLVLDLIHRDQRIPKSLTDRVAVLRNAALIEPAGFGRGAAARYLLSRSLYAHMRLAGTYTRKRGLDRETNKELLLKHLRDSEGSGATLAELRQVLPTLSESAIQRLLDELRTGRRVHLLGVRRWARWHASAPALPDSADGAQNGS
ncbi:MAG: ATP-binding protein [Gammaproteobacteria bacterium]